MSRPGRVIAIVGMQYGSEGKGYISYLLASITQVAIRTGAPNAGHTFHHDGREYKMRQVPCGFVNPAALLLIGPGGLVNPTVLADEIAIAREGGFDLRGRLFVHENVGLIEQEQLDRERDQKLTQRLGSTAEGVGAATADRVMRTLSTAGERIEALPPEATVIGRSEYLEMLSAVRTSGGNVVLEGTQGADLSLYHGPYPYVTSRDVSSSSLLGAAGLPPTVATDIIGVVRSHPIRVAGNSGNLPYETSFDQIGVSEERTTVTRKVRRIARFDPVAFRRACLLNGPTSLALTFTDYLAETAVQPWRRQVESIGDAPVDYLGISDVAKSWKKPGSLLAQAHEEWAALSPQFD